MESSVLVCHLVFSLVFFQLFFFKFQSVFIFWFSYDIAPSFLCVFELYSTHLRSIVLWEIFRRLPVHDIHWSIQFSVSFSLFLLLFFLLRLSFSQDFVKLRYDFTVVSIVFIFFLATFTSLFSGIVCLSVLALFGSDRKGCREMVIMSEFKHTWTLNKKPFS